MNELKWSGMMKSLFVNFIASIDSYAAIRFILISSSRRTLDFKNVLVCFFSLVLFLSLSINNIRHSCFHLWFHIKFVSISQWSTVFMYPMWNKNDMPDLFHFSFVFQCAQLWMSVVFACLHRPSSPVFLLFFLWYVF